MKFTTQVVVKFINRGEDADVAHVFETRGVNKMTQVFADEPAGSELATLYMLEIDSTVVQDVLETLRWEPGVEYAEVVLPKINRRLAHSF